MRIILSTPILLLSFWFIPAKGQQLYMEFGRVLSSFDYEDSEGHSLNNLTGASNNWMAVGYRAPIAQKKWFLLGGVSYARYGAKGSDPALDNYYSWDVSYLGANGGVEYEFFKQQNFFTDQDGFSFYTRVAIATEFLLQGTQVVNNQVYNLVGEEQFDKPVFFARGGVGANYCVSRKLAVFLQYMGGKSFLIFGGSDDKEKLQYVTHSFSFGLLLSFPQCDYCHSTL